MGAAEAPERENASNESLALDNIRFVAARDGVRGAEVEEAGNADISMADGEGEGGACVKGECGVGMEKEPLCE